MAKNSESSIAVVTGKRVSRIDGPLKVSGQATYTSDHSFDRMAYAVPVGATVANGKIKKLDASQAKKMKGVLEVFTKDNIGDLFRPTPDEGFTYRTDEPRPPFEDEVIRYYGQYVAVVVAETFEIAQAAAKSVKITYESKTPNLKHEMTQEDQKKTDSERGKAEAEFEKGPVKLNHTYVTPTEVHNPIEMHATVAVWEPDGGVTLYETSQAIETHKNVLSQALGVPADKVRVISKFLGSGFGGKLWAWPHSAMAAASARKLQRPVKLVIDRSMMFMNVGHRPLTQQQIKISCDQKGKLLSLQHHSTSAVDLLGEYKEDCGEATSYLYSVANLKVTTGIARRNRGSPTSMRGPGAVPGLFALESAMDELAIELKMDPVQLRILNDTLTDESTGKPFSSRHFKECLELGAKKFGWEKRNPQVGSMRKEGEILGWGVAACTWLAQRLDASAAVEFGDDGKVRILCGTHDIGTGMYTALAQMVSEQIGVPFSRIEVSLGDTTLPKGPLAGGSMATGSAIPAVLEATKAAVKSLLAGAAKSKDSPFHGEKPESLKFEKGEIRGKKSSMDFAALLKKINMKTVAGSGSAKGDFGDPASKVTTKSFGAQFVEIGWQPEIARLRVKRVVSVIDAGRIINYQPAKNQIEGAIVMGIGMGIFEKSEYDERFGKPINNSLADYVVAVHADCPHIDVTFLDYPDKALNELGARGVGEIGLAGMASALTAAVYHATGVRVRELPVTIESLIKTT
jgi:xanthine dehydrogenase YagR molybdenum-binding subunit